MSYITLIGKEEEQKNLQEKNDKLLADIRKIVGSKRFDFSPAYLEKYRPKIGVGDRPINGITKKYVYVSCFLQHSNNENNTEYGAIIKRFPIAYQRGCGSFVNKVELTDLFIADLEKILRELKFYLWWETEVRLPKVRAQYNELLEYEKKYNKMLSDVGLDEDVTKTWKENIRE